MENARETNCVFVNLAGAIRGETWNQRLALIWRHSHPVAVELSLWQTVTCVWPVTSPVNPCMLAEITTEPKSRPEVSIPAELTDATPGALDCQVTIFVMSCRVWGWLPSEKTPVAVSCSVSPAPPKTVADGEISMETNPGLLQPTSVVKAAARQRSKSPRTQRRSNMQVS